MTMMSEQHSMAYNFGFLIGVTDGAADEIAVLLRYYPEEFSDHVRERLITLAEKMRNAVKQSRSNAVEES